MRDEARWWFDTALRDLDLAQAAFDRELFEGCAFHCQQAAEKALKALLAERGEHTRTHACVRLLEELSAAGAETFPIATAARRLDPHYIAARYPNGAGGPPELFYDKQIAGNLLDDARSIVEFARGQLGS